MAHVSLAVKRNAMYYLALVKPRRNKRVNLSGLNEICANPGFIAHVKISKQAMLYSSPNWLLRELDGSALSVLRKYRVNSSPN